MDWLIIDSGRLPCQAIMDKDTQLLHELDQIGQPILHLYSWQGNCATYGCFIDPLTELNQAGVNRYQIQLAQRPTGGGILFHLTDYAFSILIPATHALFSTNTLDNYACINRLVIRALSPLLGKMKTELFVAEKEEKKRDLFCMAKPTYYDIIVEGKKLGGAAQRRTKKGFLHQGTLSLAPVSLEILQATVSAQTVERMQAFTCPLLTLTAYPDIEDLRKEIKDLLLQAVQKN